MRFVGRFNRGKNHSHFAYILTNKYVHMNYMANSFVFPLCLSKSHLSSTTYLSNSSKSSTYTKSYGSKSLFPRYKKNDTSAVTPARTLFNSSTDANSTYTEKNSHDMEIQMAQKSQNFNDVIQKVFKNYSSQRKENFVEPKKKAYGSWKTGYSNVYGSGVAGKYSKESPSKYMSTSAYTLKNYNSKGKYDNNYLTPNYGNESSFPKTYRSDSKSFKTTAHTMSNSNKLAEVVLEDEKQIHRSHASSANTKDSSTLWNSNDLPKKSTFKKDENNFIKMGAAFNTGENTQEGVSKLPTASTYQNDKFNHQEYQKNHLHKELKQENIPEYLNPEQPIVSENTSTETSNKYSYQSDKSNAEASNKQARWSSAQNNYKNYKNNSNDKYAQTNRKTNHENIYHNYPQSPYSEYNNSTQSRSMNDGYNQHFNPRSNPGYTMQHPPYGFTRVFHNSSLPPNYSNMNMHSNIAYENMNEHSSSGKMEYTGITQPNPYATNVAYTYNPQFYEIRLLPVQIFHTSDGNVVYNVIPPHYLPNFTRNVDSRQAMNGGNYYTHIPHPQPQYIYQNIPNFPQSNQFYPAYSQNSYNQYPIRHIHNNPGYSQNSYNQYPIQHTHNNPGYSQHPHNHANYYNGPPQNSQIQFNQPMNDINNQQFTNNVQHPIMNESHYYYGQNDNMHFPQNNSHQRNPNMYQPNHSSNQRYQRLHQPRFSPSGQNKETYQKYNTDRNNMKPQKPVNLKTPRNSVQSKGMNSNRRSNKITEPIFNSEIAARNKDSKWVKNASVESVNEFDAYETAPSDNYSLLSNETNAKIMGENENNLVASNESIMKQQSSDTDSIVEDVIFQDFINSETTTTTTDNTMSDEKKDQLLDGGNNTDVNNDYFISSSNVEQLDNDTRNTDNALNDVHLEDSSQAINENVDILTDESCSKASSETAGSSEDILAVDDSLYSLQDGSEMKYAGKERKQMREEDPYYISAKQNKMASETILSWNINGIKSIFNKYPSNLISKMVADIVCLQEVRTSSDAVKNILEKISSETGESYFVHVNSCEAQPGRSGVVILSKKRPKKIIYDMMSKKYTKEGRVITAEFDSYYLVNVYVPQSGINLENLPLRLDWDDHFRQFVIKLKKKKKNVIIVGDFNATSSIHDFFQTNKNIKFPSCTKEERISFHLTRRCVNGVDTCWHFLFSKYPTYTFWWNRNNSRNRDNGMRLDYFLVPYKMIPLVYDSHTLSDEPGSDHCPIILAFK